MGLTIFYKGEWMDGRTDKGEKKGFVWLRVKQKLQKGREKSKKNHKRKAAMVQKMWKNVKKTLNMLLKCNRGKMASEKYLNEHFPWGMKNY